MQRSKYNDTRNLKITYFLGAGASFNALPIWKGQGNSMVEVANQIRAVTNNTDVKKSPETAVLFYNSELIDLANKMSNYGSLAVEFGSIDVYARRLHLLGENEELNNLKYHLSVYFDLWENFIYKNQIIDLIKKTHYQKIDKRYYSLLSVLLEKNGNTPKLNDLVSFISWNYDLQMEMAYKSFLPNNANSLKDINSGFRFLTDEENDNDLDIIHLNGHRGVFKNGGKTYSNVRDNLYDSFEEYLLGLLDNTTQFRRSKIDYSNCMKYAWETESKSLEYAKKVMRDTDILIIIGYSFPSYNRKIDSELINEFEKKSSRQIIYQDPNANQELLKSIFRNTENVKFKKENTNQFHIPHEFLFPTAPAEPNFGINY